MKKTDVQINATYLVKVAGNLVPVKITREHDNGGWEGTSVKTGKTIRIKSAQRLRKQLADAAPVAKKPEETTKDAKVEPERDTGERDANGGERGDVNPLTRAYEGKKLSGLDAAAKVLALGSALPMRCGDLVKIMIDRGYWQTNGKTPAATIYAAITREIKTKGDASRFRKVERGKFELVK